MITSQTLMSAKSTLLQLIRHNSRYTCTTQLIIYSNSLNLKDIASKIDTYRMLRNLVRTRTSQKIDVYLILKRKKYEWKVIGSILE